MLDVAVSAKRWLDCHFGCCLDPTIPPSDGKQEQKHGKLGFKTQHENSFSTSSQVAFRKTTGRFKQLDELQFGLTWFLIQEPVYVTFMWMAKHRLPVRAFIEAPVSARLAPAITWGQHAQTVQDLPQASQAWALD